MTVSLSDEADLGLTEALEIIDNGRPVGLDPGAARRLDAGFARFSGSGFDGEIYGVNTGLGPMVTTAVDPGKLVRQQRNLILSHASGMGPPLAERDSRAVALARAKSLAGGRSAVRARLPAMICEALNAHVAPVVPRHGGVGASGDLVQLAHLALMLIGEGDAWRDGGIEPAGAALRSAGLEPLELQFRDGLALVNGVSAMTGIGLVALADARRLVDHAILLAAAMAEITGAGTEFASEGLAAVKRHPGHHAVARRLRAALEGSRALTRETPRPLQEHYSIRCTPQILGAIEAVIANAEAAVLAELNSISDNPVFIPDTGEILHGGNFHGEPVAMAMDQLKAAMVKLSILFERQLNFLLNDAVNTMLPPFLNGGELGVDFGFQGAQFTAVSTTAHNQSLAYPMAAHSISTNKDNQDVVSLGADAALMAAEVIDNGFSIAAILSLAVREAMALSEMEDAISNTTRGFFSVFERRRSSAPLSPQIEEVKAQLKRMQGHDAG